MYFADMGCVRTVRNFATQLFVSLDFHIYIGLIYNMFYALLVLIVVFNLFYVTLDILLEIKLTNPAI